MRWLKSAPPHDLTLTTEKDAVKLGQLREIDLGSIGVVKIAVELSGVGSSVLDQMINDVLTTKRLVSS